MPQPARQRRGELVLKRLGDEQKSGRPGTAVEIFIAAPDRGVGTRRIEIDRDRASAVRQIPQHQRARLMRRSGQALHVVAAAAAIIDVGQHHHCRVRIDRGFDRLGIDRA